eukprot:TRINITY_DN2673_c0_g1_i4.p1 TRINITY_DN2673_c0_g1~~TRINITY_DN2673_c0_g1_i4.p1  ORF type:complete len:271 (-),score=26.62 TRINITY_DN2673_c0_g1_i4:54-866(-)
MIALEKGDNRIFVLNQALSVNQTLYEITISGRGQFNVTNSVVMSSNGVLLPSKLDILSRKFYFATHPKWWRYQIYSFNVDTYETTSASISWQVNDGTTPLKDFTVIQKPNGVAVVAILKGDPFDNIYVFQPLQQTSTRYERAFQVGILDGFENPNLGYVVSVAIINQRYYLRVKGLDLSTLRQVGDSALIPHCYDPFGDNFDLHATFDANHLYVRSSNVVGHYNPVHQVSFDGNGINNQTAIGPLLHTYGASPDFFYFSSGNETISRMSC